MRVGKFTALTPSERVASFDPPFIMDQMEAGRASMRLAAIEALALINPPDKSDKRESLIGALDDPSPQVREVVLLLRQGCSGGLPGGRAVSPLRGLLGQGDQALQRVKEKSVNSLRSAAAGIQLNSITTQGYLFPRGIRGNRFTLSQNRLYSDHGQVLQYGRSVNRPQHYKIDPLHRWDLDEVLSLIQQEDMNYRFEPEWLNPDGSLNAERLTGLIFESGVSRG